MYHSGDLARLNDDGEIDFLGRIDSQIKLHGLRIELDEIEAVMSSHPHIKRCAVKVSGSGRNAYLCGYYEADEPLPANELKAFMAQHLTYYMIPSVMLQMEHMPVSTAGKIDRQNLPDIAADDNIVEPESKTQEAVLEIVNDVLKPESTIGITTDLFRLGLTSLLAVQINAGLYDKFGCEISIMDLLKNPSVIQIEQLINKNQGAGSNIEFAKFDEYELTDNQTGVYIECQKNLDDLKYNMPVIYKFAEGVDVYRLADSVKKALNNHKAVYSYVVESPEGLRLHRNDSYVPEVPVIRTDNPDKQNFVRAFDLTSTPLFRTAIYYNDQTACLYFDAHHIIFDGESMNVLLSDIKAAYDGIKLTPETLSVFEYSLIESRKKKESYETDKAWLLSHFAGKSTPTSLAAQKISSKSEASRLFRKVNFSLKDFEQHAGVTASTIILSAFTMVLSRITRSDDIVMAAIWDGRNDIRFAHSVGMFVKTLPVGISFAEDDTAFSFSRRLQQTIYDTAAHDSISYAEFCSLTSLNAEILYVYQNHYGFDAISSALVDTGVKFPVVLSVLGNELILEYDNSKYDAVFMSQLMDLIVNTVSMLCEAPAHKLSCLSICPESDLTLLNTWNTTETEFPHGQTIVSIFEEQAKKTPEKTALITSDENLTYDELNRHSNRIANALIERGIVPEDIIAVKMSRCANILCVFMGIMKAGAAYLPLDMNYPESRIEYYMNDSGAKLLIDDSSVLELLQNQNEINPEISISDENLCYIIYTSGSTGKPKGVQTLHRGVLDFCLPLEHNSYAMTISNDCTVSLAVGSLAFDIAVAEIFPFLLTGKTIVLADDQQNNDVVQLASLASKYHVDAMLCTPSRLLQYLDYEPFAKELSHFHSITAAGEAVPQEWLKRLRSLTNAKLYNGYGPTEATCGSLFLEMNGDYINIGKPLANEKIHIVDQWHNLLPVGIVGELCISGYGLARGYLNRQKLTSEKFITVPYVNGRMYCTGDLAKWNDRGEVEFIGRIDNQVKFHGYRIELGEIEEVINSHDDIESCVVVVKGSTLAAYYTAKREIHPDEIKAFLKNRLPNYMIPTALLQLEKMPLDLNAKIDRRSLPEIVIDARKNFVSPENDRERAICEVFAEILGVDSVSAVDSFFALGGDSIKGIRVTSGLLKFGYRMQMRQLFEAPSARELAPLLVKSSVPEERIVNGTAPLSAIQRYFFTMDFDDKNHWNQSSMFDLGRKITLETLERALTILCEHHDELRATFKNMEQEISHEGGYFTLLETKDDNYIDLLPVIQKKTSITGPKIAALLIHGQDKDKIFMAVHHLVIDVVSWSIIAQDLMTLIEAGDSANESLLPQKTTSYMTYSRALEEYTHSGNLRDAEIYWKSARKINSLPQDMSFTGRRTADHQKSITRELDSSLTAKVQELTKIDSRLGMNEIILSVLSTSLKKVFGVKEVSYLLEGHGRENFDDSIDVSRTVGWFTSFYPVNVSVESTNLEMLNTLVNTLKAIPDNGFTFTLLKYIAGLDLVLKPQVLVNYLGEVSGTFTYNLGSKWDVSQDSTTIAQLSLTGAVTNGKLLLMVDYDEREFFDARINNLMSEFESELAALVNEWEKAFGISDNIEAVYPANEIQTGMLLLARHYKHEAMYHEQIMFVVPEQIDPEKLKSRLRELTAKYQALRSVFVSQNFGQVYQVVMKEYSPDYEYIDVRKYSHEWKPGEELTPIMSNYLKSLMYADREENFAPEHKPMFRCKLLRLTDNSFAVMFSFSHVILDKWSMDIILSELFGTQAIIGKDNYSSYVKYTARKNHAESLRFWSELMTGAPDTIFPSLRKNSDISDYVTLEKSTAGDLVNNLKALSAGRNISLSTIVQYAWACALMKVLNVNDISFGYTWSGRPGDLRDVDKMVGMFIRPLPFRVTSSTTLEQLQRINLDIEKHAYVTGAEIQKAAHLRHPAFRYFMTFQNTSEVLSVNGAYEIFSHNRSRNEFSVFVNIDKAVNISISYDRNLFAQDWVENLAEEFISAVNEVIYL